MNENELKILDELRKNARCSMTQISKTTRIPLSTVFKKIIKFEKDIIKKYVSLMNFNKLGFSVRISLVLKAKDRAALKEFLTEHPNVNSLYRISQEYDFFAETIFPTMLDYERFIEKLDCLISNKKTFHMIEDLRQEDFSLVER